jgi:hypothetical protein
MRGICYNTVEDFMNLTFAIGIFSYSFAEGSCPAGQQPTRCTNKII